MGNEKSNDVTVPQDPRQYPGAPFTAERWLSFDAEEFDGVRTVIVTAKYGEHVVEWSARGGLWQRK